MQFSQNFLDELTARCDIADVVGSYVNLTPKGGDIHRELFVFYYSQPASSDSGPRSRSSSSLIATLGETPSSEHSLRQ